MLFMNYTAKGRPVAWIPNILEEKEPDKPTRTAKEKPLEIPVASTVKEQLGVNMVKPIVLRPKAPRNNIRFVV